MEAVIDRAPFMDQAQLQLIELATGYWWSRAIFCAAELGIADLLRAGPKPVGELATASRADPAALYRVLRMLASRGVFRELEARVFELTPGAEPLRSDHPGGVRDMVILAGGELFEGSHRFLDAVRAGADAAERAGAEGFLDRVLKAPDRQATYLRAAGGLVEAAIPVLLASYDWSRFGRVVDLGAGDAGTLRALLAAHRHMTGVCFDLPHVVERTKARLGGSLERCVFVSGYIFSNVPSGADCYLLQRVLAEFGDDEDCVRILSNCAEVMNDDSVVLVCEKPLDDHGAHGAPGAPGAQGARSFVEVADVARIVCGGRERRLAEYDALFAASGLTRSSHIRTSSSVDLIEARRKG